MASKKRPGLYANIHAKRRRIAAGSGEKMRSPGDKGAPTAKNFEEAAKTAKKAEGGEVKLTDKQMKIATQAAPKDKITGADFEAMRTGKMKMATGGFAEAKMTCPHRPDGVRGGGQAVKGMKFTGVK
tara:strand:+ start:4073 stop:4453 length:381 start_codon:yes stop_codon:yes gene_type:complete